MDLVRVRVGRPGDPAQARLDPDGAGSSRRRLAGRDLPARAGRWPGPGRTRRSRPSWRPSGRALRCACTGTARTSTGCSTRRMRAWSIRLSRSCGRTGWEVVPEVTFNVFGRARLNRRAGIPSTARRPARDRGQVDGAGHAGDARWAGSQGAAGTAAGPGSRVDGAPGSAVARPAGGSDVAASDRRARGDDRGAPAGSHDRGSPMDAGPSDVDSSAACCSCQSVTGDSSTQDPVPTRPKQCHLVAGGQSWHCSND